MLRSLLTASLLGALALGGCDLSATCPCGARTSDPLSEHELGFGGSHEVDDECVCRCGLDTPFALPRDRSCEEYQRACEDSAGVERELVCE